MIKSFSLHWFYRFPDPRKFSAEIRILGLNFEPSEDYGAGPSSDVGFDFGRISRFALNVWRRVAIKFLVAHNLETEGCKFLPSRYVGKKLGRFRCVTIIQIYLSTTYLLRVSQLKNLIPGRMTSRLGLPIKDNKSYQKLYLRIHFVKSSKKFEKSGMRNLWK